LPARPVPGTWTLLVYDTNTGNTSTLNSWTLTVAAGKPFKT
jgi:subtilisin-like proprotein convertase family protein